MKFQIIPEDKEIVGPQDIADKDLEILFVSRGVRALLQETCFQCACLRYVIFATGSRLETIGHMAFAETDVCSITVPPGVTDLGQAVFASCYELR